MTQYSEYIDALNFVTMQEGKSQLNRQIALVKAEIQKLPPRCKKTFLLSKESGLTNLEIAEHMNVSIKTVERQMTKAYKLLRDALGKKMKTILLLLFNRKVKFLNVI